MINIESLSESELKSLIENASLTLKEIQIKNRKDIIAKIKEMAASANLIVEIHEADIKKHEKISTRAGFKLPPKYRHPENPELTWTGRGIAPKWMQDLLANGSQKSEFEI